jgi:glycosyltransferase involved in cell wall biosynthesis
MNVLIVVPWDQEFGGVASVVGNVARQLEKKGHGVWFLHPGEAHSLQPKVTKWNFPGYELNLRNLFVREHPIKSVAGFVLYLSHTLLQLHKLLQRHDIDIVNIHYPIGSGIYFSWLRWFHRFKLVISVHGADLFPGGHVIHYSKPLRMLMESADWLVAPSQSTLDTALDRFPVLRPKCSAIHNAVDLGEFQQVDSRGPQARPYILCIALHHIHKALDVLVKAFVVFHRTHPEVELWLVGDGPYRSELEVLVRQLGLTESVRFLGLQGRSTVCRLLAECSLFVLPSRVEPFGIAIIEALASGKPVISTKVGGIPEIIENGTNGILVEPDDPQALCEAMRTVWDDPVLARRFADAGQATVKQHFQWEIPAARYEAIFLNLLGQNDRRPVG